MPSLELLQAAPKAPGSFDRCVPLEQTLALIPQLCERYGITRIADITYLDRIGIPVFSAIVPESPDIISVYNGKGATRESALVGAVMEAVERQAAAAPHLPVFMRDAETVLDALDPSGRELVRCNEQLAVVSGIDLFSGDATDVPLALVQFPWDGELVTEGTSTNGLAAGNSFAEAVYHALCELLERHLWAIAHALGHLRPQAIISRFAGGEISVPGLVDDPSIIEIELLTGSAPVDALVERIQRAGLTVALRAFEREPFPMLMVATIADRAGGESAAHSGHGCSWSPEHAAIRAITEAAQSRAADFLAAREDLCHHDATDMPDYGVPRWFGVPFGRWYYDAPAPRRSLGSFADQSTDDVAGDVALLVKALNEAASGPIAIVDLSPHNLPVHIVRAVAPRFERRLSYGRFGPAVRAILDLESPVSR